MIEMIMDRLFELGDMYMAQNDQVRRDVVHECQAIVSDVFMENEEQKRKIEPGETIDDILGNWLKDLEHIDVHETIAGSYDYEYNVDRLPCMIFQEPQEMMRHLLIHSQEYKCYARQYRTSINKIEAERSRYKRTIHDLKKQVEEMEAEIYRQSALITLLQNMNGEGETENEQTE